MQPSFESSCSENGVLIPHKTSSTLNHRLMQCPSLTLSIREGCKEIYRIKLPGPPTLIGEGIPENQNHAIIFTRGEALQTRDMNQDNYYEESFKMRNVLEEFRKEHNGQRKPTILGIREHIFTGSVSSLACFMSNEKTSLVTIGHRILANPLRFQFGEVCDFQFEKKGTRCSGVESTGIPAHQSTIPVQFRALDLH
ncbi:putative callose synthase 6 [Glycine soja]|uniref:Putative callose synthase 6 n=1 Tax=Glycine soja TaxID=3848 RepID=A0A445FRQ3_GLYSO|nr:putative callose synthase 6 [Glycine soja]